MALRVIKKAKSGKWDIKDDRWKDHFSDAIESELDASNYITSYAKIKSAVKKQLNPQE